MSYITNPILKGFNPDPSICRVGDDYYIATSTFEWFPGVQIHHSKDLKNWEVIAHPLDRISQLEMKGVPDSCGVWAPCLSYHKGLFYLVYTNVKSFDGVWKDTPNYVVTSEDILGEWSEPAYLNSSGFDGSFFHDGDKTWFITMLVDHRKGKFFGGIELQEFHLGQRKLIGDVFYLTEGTEIGLSEGPHLYKRNGYYYLLLAEGGTEYGHAATVMRSKSITGPYEANTNNPILTTRNYPDHALQKAGHASMVATAYGDWYIVFLVGRPLTKLGSCILGRETAIEELVWKEDWPVLKTETSLPRLLIPASNLPEFFLKKTALRADFDTAELSIDFQSLRVPKTSDWFSLTERKGYMRLKGKESLSSTHTQALIARRLQHFNAEIQTKIEFEPENFQQLAGLVVYYNTGHYHYLYLSMEEGEKVLSVLSSDNFEIIEQKQSFTIPSGIPIVLRAVIAHDTLQFSFSSNEIDFQPIGAVLDMSMLSDDYVREGSERYRPAFTGCFVGMCCQDLKTNNKEADFDWFEYKPLEDHE